MIKKLSIENQTKLEKLISSNNFSEIEKFIYLLKKTEQETPFVMNL